MQFDIVVGNPPYGVAQKGNCPNLHLKIMNSMIKYCTDKLVFIMPGKPLVVQLKEPWIEILKNAVCNRIEVVSKEVFKGTDMDNTAIYYCDMNDDTKNYCKKLDVDNVIYNAIDSPAHRLFIDKMSGMSELKISFIFGSQTYYQNDLKRFTEKSSEKFYLNLNRVSIQPGAGETQFFSNILKETDILSKAEEIEFCKKHTKRKNVIECPSKEYGENLKNLMLNGLVLRYGLWVTQNNRALYQAQFKYVADIDYSNIHSDEELLSACMFSEEEIKMVMNYLNDFDFSKNRNEIIRKYEN